MQESIAERIVKRARARRMTLAVAESLTGGRVVARLIDVPGASQAVLGGIVSYHTSLKRSLLDVDGALLDEMGPVHPDVAVQMARGVRYACAVPASTGDVPIPADIGIATTGVAGPDPDPVSSQAPGVVWIGVSSLQGEHATRLTLGGDREAIREATVQATLELLEVNLSQLD